MRVPVCGVRRPTRGPSAEPGRQCGRWGISARTAGGAVAICVAALGLGAGTSSLASRSSARPNVVILLADYMGYGDTGPYGAVDIETPNLDRLAREGVRLTNAYAAAPICSPSRAALLTGRYPLRLGLEENVAATPGAGLDPAEVTLAESLAAAGYATGMVGKWHLGYEPPVMPNAQGFDEFFGFLDWSIDYYSHRTIGGDPGLVRNTTRTRRGRLRHGRVLG